MPAAALTFVGLTVKLNTAQLLLLPMPNSQITEWQLHGDWICMQGCS